MEICERGATFQLENCHLHASHLFLSRPRAKNKRRAIYMRTCAPVHGHGVSSSLGQRRGVKPWAPSGTAAHNHAANRPQQRQAWRLPRSASHRRETGHQTLSYQPPQQQQPRHGAASVAAEETTQHSDATAEGPPHRRRPPLSCRREQRWGLRHGCRLHHPVPSQTAAAGRPSMSPAAERAGTRPVGATEPPREGCRQHRQQRAAPPPPPRSKCRKMTAGAYCPLHTSRP